MKHFSLYLQDFVLAEILRQQSDWIVTYHEHDSLLENVVDESLTEEERKAAWSEYEAEKEGRMLQMANPGLNVIPGMVRRYMLIVMAVKIN